MSTPEPTTGVVVSTLPHSTQAIRGPKLAASRGALFVIPRGREGGLQASIRGHLLELADPSSAHGLAPTPDDLLIASIASDLAWLPDNASVSADWRGLKSPPSLADVSVTVSASKSAEAMSGALEEALEKRVAARSFDDPMRLNLRCVG